MIAGLTEQSEIKEPKNEFALACERIGVDPAEHIGDWRTFQLVNPNVPREVVGRFLESDEFIQRIDSALDKRFDEFKSISMKRLRSDFRSINSIADLTLDQIVELVNSKKLVAWMNKFTGKEGALLVGPTATGKTISVYGACQMAIESLKRVPNSDPDPGGRSFSRGSDCPTIYGPLPAWHSPVSGLQVISAREIGNLRDHSKLGEDEPMEISTARSCRLLFIDDLGWERPHQSQAVADVLASRYDNGVSTIATSGLGISELSARYGDAVIRRVFETAGRKGAIVEA